MDRRFAAVALVFAIIPGAVLTIGKTASAAQQPSISSFAQSLPAAGTSDSIPSDYEQSKAHLYSISLPTGSAGRSSVITARDRALLQSHVQVSTANDSDALKTGFTTIPRNNAKVLLASFSEAVQGASKANLAALGSQASILVSTYVPGQCFDVALGNGSGQAEMRLYVFDLCSKRVAFARDVDDAHWGPSENGTFKQFYGGSTVTPTFELLVNPIDDSETINLVQIDEDGRRGPQNALLDERGTPVRADVKAASPTPGWSVIEVVNATTKDSRVLVSAKAGGLEIIYDNGSSLISRRLSQRAMTAGSNAVGCRSERSDSESPFWTAVISC